VSFTDGSWHHGRKVPLKQSEATNGRVEGLDPSAQRTAQALAEPNPIRKKEVGRMLSLGKNGPEEAPYFPQAVVAPQDVPPFPDRLHRRKVKLCKKCGEVMKRSSRMILSPLAGLLLLFTGSALMVLYGLSTNFYQTPWYARFLLPASYYIGSLFLGVGLLFFFIREKIWYCENCKELDKR